MTSDAVPGTIPITCVHVMLQLLCVCVCLFVLQEPSGVQLLLYGVGVLLVPHYLVGICALHHLYSHLWLCPAILVHCVWRSQRELALVLSHINTLNYATWKQGVATLGWRVCAQLVQFLMALSCGFVLWPVVPFFLCDFLFCAVVWNTVWMLFFRSVQFVITGRGPRPQDGIP